VLNSGPKTLAGGDLCNVLRTAGDRREGASNVARMGEGSLQVTIDARYSLPEATAAHAYLESRRALDKVLLIH